MNEVIIGIGSNIDSEENIQKTLDVLKNDFQVLGISNLIRTKPIGITNQADFVNGAVKIKCELQQEELKKYLRKLEDKLGRDRTLPKFGPRTIDLDIVIWNNKVVDEDFYSRDFLQESCRQLGFDL